MPRGLYVAAWGAICAACVQLGAAVWIKAWNKISSSHPRPPNRAQLGTRAALRAGGPRRAGNASGRIRRVEAGARARAVAAGGTYIAVVKAVACHGFQQTKRENDGVCLQDQNE